MILNIVCTLGPWVTHIEVARLYRVDEVLIGLCDGRVIASVRVKFVVHCHETVLQALTQVYGGFLSKDISLARLPRVPLACPARYRIISCFVGQVLRLTDSHTEVCLLLLQYALELCLLTAVPARTQPLLVLFLRVVSGWVLAKDEVCTSELIYDFAARVLRLEVSPLEISAVDLLL